MKRVIRFLTRFSYQKVAKPLLFKRKADRVHKGLVKTAKNVQKVPGVRALPHLWSHHDRTMLSQEIFGLSFRNPVGLSAGFDKSVEMPRLMKAVGFGFMTGGSVTLGQYGGNNGDWYYRLPKSKSLVVNAGLPSEGTPVVAERVNSYSEDFFDNFPLNISIAKTNSKQTVSEEQGVDDYMESLGVFDKLAQVKMLEINISCPNTFGGEPFTTPGRLEKLLTVVDKAGLSKPVFIKMPISLPEKQFDDLVEVIARHKITGVTVGNLLKDRKKAKLQDDLPADVQGNLSGRPNRELSTELVRRIYKKYGNQLVIIGVGGVMSAEDAYEKIRAGSSLVALITGMIFEGPQVIGDINHGLVKLLKRDGFSNVSQAVGADFRD